MNVSELVSRQPDSHEIACERCHEPVDSPYVMVSVEAPVCVGCMTTRELDQLGRDLDKAMALDRLLHRDPPRIDGWEFAVHRSAARYLSGDIVDIHDQGERFSLAVGDVMGKGLPAAMLRVVLQSGFRAVGTRRPSAIELTATARSLLDSADASMGLVSLFSADVVSETGEVRYVNAGHPPPILVRASSGVEPLTLGATAPILGFDVGREVSDTEARRVRMAPGDLLAAYSDGVTEAESSTGELYETERLVRALSARRSSNDALSAICRDIVEEIERFSIGRGTDARDDRTLVMLRRVG